MEKIKNKLNEMHWRRAIAIILVLALLFLVCLGFHYNSIRDLKTFYTDTSGLVNMNYVTQILAMVAAIAGVFIAVWQYTLSVQAERVKFENEKVERAVTLAGYYKDEIVNRYGLLREIFEKSGILDYLVKINIEDMENFDVDELAVFMPEKDECSIKDILDSDNFMKIVITAAKKRGFIEQYEQLRKMDEEKKKDEIFSREEKEIIRLTFLNEILNLTLNNLEYFAMGFTHNIANEAVVYTSLSQTYLSMVQMLYYNIAKNNHDAERYFTNVIKLFNVWKKRWQEKEAVLKDMKRKCIEFGESAKRV